MVLSEISLLRFISEKFLCQTIKRKGFDKEMKNKAREELKPQQPHGCEDFDDDRNEVIRSFANPAQR